MKAAVFMPDQPYLPPPKLTGFASVSGTPSDKVAWTCHPSPCSPWRSSWLWSPYV